jgi:hypothetical protein
MCKIIKSNPSLTLYTKINSKWIKGLIATPEATKLLGKNIWGKLLDTGNDFIPKCSGYQSKTK